MVTAIPNAVAAQSVSDPCLTAAAVATVARGPAFRTTDPGYLAALTPHLTPVHFSRRERIYSEGDGGSAVYILISGKVGLSTRAANGRHHMLAILGPSEMFGELPIFDPGPHTASATALTDVDAVSLHRDVFRSWVAHRPEITERLLRVMARRLRRTDEDLTDLVFIDTGARVAKQLLRLAQRFGVQENGAMRLTHDLTQGEIAQLVGASRETVNKVLTDFTQHGWIRLQGHSMVILEAEPLVHRSLSPGPDGVAPSHAASVG